jgi:hypothetical protein
MFMVLLGITRHITASVVSTSDARLPMSLSTVISDLEAEDCTELTTACLLLSHSVTSRERANLLGELLGTASLGNSDGDNESASASPADLVSSWKAIGTTAGLALAQPSTTQEVASTVEACGGTILYYPSKTDLARGEGLFDSLAPAMEKILSTDGIKKGCLLVIVEDNDSTTQSKLEKAAEAVLLTLITEKPVSVLRDVFDKVMYVSPKEAVEVLTRQLDQSTTPSFAAASIATAVSSDLSLLFPTTSAAAATTLSAADLAAARKLGPAARKQRAQVLQFVQDSCQNRDGTPKLVPEFGNLCDAAVQRAMEDLDEESAGSASLIQSGLGKQIRSSLSSELFSELGDLLQDQLDLLQRASFEDCTKKMSALRVSPNLASDMEDVTKKSLLAFGKAANRLVAKKASSWSVQPAKQQYAIKLKGFRENRLLVAQASGQYKPVPRKGVTLGFHWLLPKPFGNDYRQEPWMVHATDNLVYVPKDKITDVNPEEVASGDWRSKIVPSPAGNDMLYLQ